MHSTQRCLSNVTEKEGLRYSTWKTPAILDVLWVHSFRSPQRSDILNHLQFRLLARAFKSMGAHSQRSSSYPANSLNGRVDACTYSARSCKRWLGSNLMPLLRPGRCARYKADCKKIQRTGEGAALHTSPVEGMLAVTPVCRPPQCLSLDCRSIWCVCSLANLVMRRGVHGTIKSRMSSALCSRLRISSAGTVTPAPRPQPYGVFMQKYPAFR